MFGYHRMSESKIQKYYTVYAGKAQQQTEANVQKELEEYQTITQSSMDKIVHTATKKGSCVFTLYHDGSISSLR